MDLSPSILRPLFAGLLLVAALPQASSGEVQSGGANDLDAAAKAGVRDRHRDVSALWRSLGCVELGRVPGDPGMG